MKKTSRLDQMINKYKKEVEEGRVVFTEEQKQLTKGFSFKAFFATPLFAIWFDLWIYFFLSLIPFIQIYPWVILSIYGNKKAWERNKHKGPEYFQARHNSLKTVISIIFLLVLMFYVLILFAGIMV